MIDASSHPLVRALLRDQLPDLEIDCTVHRDDEMLLTDLREHDWDFALIAYFDRGTQAFQSHRRILRAWFPDGFDGDVLEFAAGFGRVTRFLARFHGPERVTAAEIQEPAVEFLRTQFGVRALRSPEHAPKFDPQRRFGVVIAHSFFSHTPEPGFREWLGQLYRLVEPGGILVFSVHDELLIAPGDRHPSGLTFRGVSESDRLQSDLYGSTWVSSAFVEDAVRKSCPRTLLHRWPRGLTNYQDLYIVGDRPIDVALDQGPFGFFSITRSEGEELELIGWASHGDPARSVAAVIALINGQVVSETTTFFARSDVVTLTGEERHRVSGWRSRFHLPDGCSRSTDVLLIKARSDTGAETILYVGTIASALLASCRAELAAAGREDVIFTLRELSTP